MLPVEITVATIIGYITTFVTGAVGWVGDFVGAITANPLLLVFVLVSFVGLGLGLIGRIIHL